MVGIITEISCEIQNLSSGWLGGKKVREEYGGPESLLVCYMQIFFFKISMFNEYVRIVSYYKFNIQFSCKFIEIFGNLNEI